MSRRNIFIALLLGFLALLFSILFGMRGGRTDYTVGAVLPLTGPGAPYGKSLQQGIELGVSDLNARGGVKGKKLRVIFEDSQGDAKAASNAFVKLVSIDHVPLVFTSISGVVLSLAPIAEKEQVVLVNVSATSPKICERDNKFVFSMIPDGGREAVYMAQKLRELQPAGPVGILYSNNAAGVDWKNRFKSETEKAGGRVVAEEGYEVGTTDFRAQLTKIRGSGATAGYLLMFGTKELASALMQSKEVGLKITWSSFSGVETSDLTSLAGDAANGLIYSYPLYTDGAKMSEFQTRYKGAYGSWADVYTITAFDAIGLIGSVLENNGAEPQAIRQGLISQKGYSGVSGSTAFNERQCTTRNFMLKTVKSGAYAPFEAVQK